MLLLIKIQSILLPHWQSKIDELLKSILYNYRRFIGESNELFSDQGCYIACLSVVEKLASYENAFSEFNIIMQISQF